MKLFRIGLVIAAASFAGCATQGSQDGAATNAQSAATARNAATSPAPAPAPHSSMDIGMGSGAAGTKSAPMMRSVYYSYDKSDITDQSRKVIEANAEYLRSHPNVKVVVEGNADERGSREYNVALGQRRADSVSKIMTLLGIGSDRIETVSYGKEKPKVIGHDESAWSQNRRSDIVYK